ncbi:MAG: hypothetical protein KDA96_03290 [Planctomycetaceae bacterium]|nr:hypothetical protein [Planctomycetaceae bacterium]
MTQSPDAFQIRANIMPFRFGKRIPSYLHAGAGPRRPFALACALVLCLLHPALTHGQDNDLSGYPTLEEMEIPSLEVLVKAHEDGDLFDWLVLKQENRVIVVQEVIPRPDPLEEIARRRERLLNQNPRNQAQRIARREELEKLENLTVILPDEIDDFSIAVRLVEKVILFEDLMLLRADKLIEERNISGAYDLITRVQRTAGFENWEKLPSRFEALLIAEADVRHSDGDSYSALALLDELARRNLNHPELQPQFARILTPMVNEALQNGDYRKTRYLIGRLSQHFPQNNDVVTWQSQLQTMASEILAEGVRLADSNDYAAAAEKARQAENIWPATGNARSVFTRLVSRHQVLRVGVERMGARPVSFPAPLLADERHFELTTVPLFEPFDAREITYFRSSFFEKWDPADLGREVIFTLRTTRPYWQSQPILTANQVADALAIRLDPTHSAYDPRLATFISEFSVRSPRELLVRFSRVPLSVEGLMRFPVVVPDTSQRSQTAPGEHLPVSLLSTRFRMTINETNNRSYERALPEPDGLDSTQYHVAEIKEIKYTDRHQMMQALVRGELDYIPQLKPWEYDAVIGAKTLEARKYQLPTNHVIVFNPMSENIVNAQLRRALSLAIDRQGILKNVILRDPEMKHGRPTSAVWPKSSYATNPSVQASSYNLRLAFAMRYAAERQLQIVELLRLAAEAKVKAKEAKQDFDTKEFMKTTNVDYIKLPPLRMVVEPDEVCMAAAEKILVYWKRIGVDMQLVAADSAGDDLADDQWDLMYRRVRIEEPLLELWPLITNSDEMDLNRLTPFPDWMRQELINLDFASSFVEAQTRLGIAHRHVAAQAFLIPLWEIDEYAAVQKSVNGLPPHMMSTYHDVERWAIRP